MTTANDHDDSARRRRSQPRPRGFTLLEVMLAVTIFGIVATAVYGTFSRTLRSKTLAERRIDVVRTGRTALGRLADEIASAALLGDPVPERRFVSVPGGSDAEPLDALYFCTLSSRGGPEARDTDQRIVDYFYPTDVGGMGRDRRADSRTGGAAAPRSVPAAEVGPADRAREDDVFDFFAGFGSDSLRARGIPAQRLLRREAPLIARGALDDAVATVFLDDVASLRFRFCDGTDWLDAWDSADSSYHGSLPRAVAIDLGLYDEDGVVQHFATAVDLALVPARTGGGTCPPWEEAVEGGAHASHAGATGEGARP